MLVFGFIPAPEDPVFPSIAQYLINAPDAAAGSMASCAAVAKQPGLAVKRAPAIVLLFSSGSP